MNNIKEKISAMYDGELDSSEIDELIEIVNSNKVESYQSKRKYE